MKRRVLFVDLETGGLAPGYSPIFEIAAQCEFDDGFPTPMTFSVAIRQDKESWARVEPSSLKVNQFSFEELARVGVPLADAASQFASWLMEFDIRGENVTWVGQNPNFDIQFLEKGMGKQLSYVGLLPALHVVNTMDLARRLRSRDKTFKPKSLSGAGIATALGLVPEDSLHRAMGGVLACRQNYYHLMHRLGAFEPVRD